MLPDIHFTGKPRLQSRKSAGGCEEARPGDHFSINSN